jgi:hypothetical protein
MTTKQKTSQHHSNTASGHAHMAASTRRMYTALGALATIAVLTIATFQLLIFVTYQNQEGDRSDMLSSLLQKTTNSATPQKTNATASTQIQSETIQAVFLTNGQVYFGRITSLTDDLVILDDVFYPKAQKTDQATTNEDASADTITEAGGVALRKLGKNEFHEPQDTLYIEPSNILYWENLEKESRVTKGILEYEAKQKAASTVKTTPATEDVSAKNEASEKTNVGNANVESEEDPEDIEEGN